MAPRADLGTRGSLTRSAVLRAAVGLADREGLEALTMRRLAQELGVEAMSLYHHVANKEAVLDGVAEGGPAVRPVGHQPSAAGPRGAARVLGVGGAPRRPEDRDAVPDAGGRGAHRRRFLVALPYGPGADWVRNVLAAGAATVEHDGRAVPVDRPALVGPAETAPHLSRGDRWVHRLFGVGTFLRVRTAPARASS